MQKSQLQNTQGLELQDAQCLDLPPMPRLLRLTMSFEPDAAQAVLPLPKLNMLEVLSIDGVSSCPSLSCLSRLTRLSLTINLSGPILHPASADLSQGVKVCHAC